MVREEIDLPLRPAACVLLYIKPSPKAPSTLLDMDNSSAYRAWSISQLTNMPPLASKQNQLGIPLSVCGVSYTQPTRDLACASFLQQQREFLIPRKCGGADDMRLDHVATEIKGALKAPMDLRGK